MTENIDRKDVFISYRRKDGATAARLLCGLLEKNGLSTFFDTESIRSGDFTQAIETNLRAARNVVIIVSQEMFQRGRGNDDGFDPIAVERDWVYREIAVALERKEKEGDEFRVVPVFVNGVTGFPDDLPTQISGIASQNGILLDHMHFDAQLKELLYRLNTPRHRLIEAFCEVQDTNYGDQLDSLVGICRALPDSVRRAERLLKELIRSRWDAVGDHEALKILIGEGDMEDLRGICKKLGVDDTGGKRKMMDALLGWVNGKDSGEWKYDAVRSRTNRVFDLAEFMARSIDSVTERKAIVALAEDVWGMDFSGLDGKRSAEDVFRSVFRVRDVEDVFEQLRRFPCLSAGNVKWMCEKLHGTNNWSRRMRLRWLAAWVNYEEEVAEVEADDEAEDECGEDELEKMG